MVPHDSDFWSVVASLCIFLEKKRGVIRSNFVPPFPAAMSALTKKFSETHQYPEDKAKSVLQDFIQSNGKRPGRMTVTTPKPKPQSNPPPPHLEPGMDTKIFRRLCDDHSKAVFEVQLANRKLETDYAEATLASNQRASAIEAWESKLGRALTESLNAKRKAEDVSPDGGSDDAPRTPKKTRRADDDGDQSEILEIPSIKRKQGKPVRRQMALY